MSLTSKMASSGIKFDGNDFAGWKQKAIAKLKAKKLWTVVKDGVGAEEKRVAAIKMVDFARDAAGVQMVKMMASEADDRALGELTLMLEDAYQPTILSAKSAREAWDTLCAVYEAEDPAMRMNLKDKVLNEKMQEDGDLQVHINKMEKIVEQLKRAGSKEEDDDMVYYIYRSLPPSWSAFVADLRTKKPDEQKLPLIKKHLLSEY